MKTSVRWFNGVRSEKEKAEIIAKLQAAEPAFKLLKEIIEKDKITSYKNRLSKDNYDKPAWPYMQADGIGEERAYNTILKLITINYEA